MWVVGLNERPIRRQLVGSSSKNWLAIVDIRLGMVVAKQLALPGIHRRELRRRGQLEAGLVE